MSRNIAVAKQMFKKPELFYVFVLQYADGTMRQQLLGITESHYKRLSLAQKWYSDLQDNLRDVDRLVGTEAADDAKNVALRIYEGMSKHGK